MKKSKLCLVHYPDGEVFFPVLKTEGHYSESPVFFEDGIYIIDVDFPNSERWKKICNRRKGMISTRGRYAIRVMLDIAKNQQDAYVPMKDVVKRQNLSLKYLEQILPDLTKNKLVEGVQGKGGGYRLVRKPEEYTIGEILRAAERELAPVACLADGAKECDRRKICQTVEFWEGFYNVINEYLDSKTLADLMKK